MNAAELIENEVYRIEEAISDAVRRLELYNGLIASQQVRIDCLKQKKQQLMTDYTTLTGKTGPKSRS